MPQVITAADRNLLDPILGGPVMRELRERDPVLWAQAGDLITAAFTAGKQTADDPSYEGWVHSDGCAVCPRCNAFISCGDDIPSILAVIPGHDCYASPGTGHYLRVPEVPADGWYWAEPDGTARRLADQPPRLPLR